MNNLVIIFLFLFGIASQLDAKSPLDAQRQREEKFELTRPKAQEYHEKMMQAYADANWNVVIEQANLLSRNYPNSPLVADACYYMAVGYFKQGEFEHANEAFTLYLTQSQNLRNFEEAVQYKYQIANFFESGMKKRLFGIKKMPKIIPARDEALAIYDEVIAAMPRSELAAQSLFKKAGLLVFFEDYKDSIEMYQTLIRRFPKNPLAPRSFLAIANVYLKQTQAEYPDPALIELAEINLKRFQAEYPQEPLLVEVKDKLSEMKGIFASELYTIGNYFIKKKKYNSAFIYFKSIINRYPDTKYQEMSYKQIEVLKKKSGKPHDFELVQS